MARRSHSTTSLPIGTLVSGLDAIMRTFHFTIPITLSLADLASTGSTGTYRTAVGSAVKPGDPDGSDVFRRMTARGFLRQMPPLATTRIDTEGVATVRAWIEALQ